MADDSHGTLHILHEPQPGQHRLDVVAIHGLNGDPFKSWTHADSTLWLRDMLPQVLEGARVMSFGYGASVFCGDTGSVRDIAKQLLADVRDKCEDSGPCPIVFLAHSLGGIVAKQALIFASSDPKHSNIAESTKGIVFFGTPHHGSDVADWTAVVSDVLQAAMVRSQSRLLHALQSHSPELWKVSTDFCPLASKYAITSFYESNEHPMLRKLVVGKMSAVMGLPHEDDIMMNGTHSSICKFAKGDRRFDRAWRAVRRTAKGVQS